MSALGENLISHGIRLRHLEPGSGHKAICPRCSHTRRDKRDPCLSVTLDHEGGAVWNCHHCQWSGNVPVDRGEPYRRTKAPVRPQVKIEDPDADVLAWFLARGIPEPVVRRNRIFGTAAWMPGPNAEVRCIAFPYFRGGELTNVKYRVLAAKAFRQEKDAEKILYGLDDITGADTVIVVEGECDKLACEAAGVLNVVSVPDGAPAKVKDGPADPDDRKFSYLANCADALESKRVIVIAVDADPPGDALAEELARRLGKDRCSRVRWPDSGDVQRKDANEVLQQDGPDVLRECIANAEPWPIEGLHEVGDFAAATMDLYRTGRARGLTTGWAEMDDFMTIRAGDLSVVTGVPGAGKSEFIDAIMVNMAERHGWRFAVCSFENPVDEHLSKLAEKRSGLPFHAGPSIRMNEADLGAALGWLREHFVFIRVEDTDTPTIDFILARARSAVTRYGIRGLVVDPYNHIESQRPDRQSETEYVSSMLTKVKRFAANHGVHVWFVAHPAKLYRENGRIPVPSLYDISGSANWANKSDMGLVIHRERKPGSNRVEVHIRKVRSKWAGRLGMLTMRYDRVNGRYSVEPPEMVPAREVADD